ncbi:hypothetical protein GGR57DRAFT_474079 [Xylariaceae sp. FL1272]|nr:hypothetical protein GGR57DRAFT_474079 [Xylariaceae sp. FL1272]
MSSSFDESGEAVTSCSMVVPARQQEHQKRERDSEDDSENSESSGYAIVKDPKRTRIYRPRYINRRDSDDSTEVLDNERSSSPELLFAPRDASDEQRPRKPRPPMPPGIASDLIDKGLIVHIPGEVEYERAVAASNLLYRFTRPICVVQPVRAREVQTTVLAARKNKTSLTIKNGGHSYSGASTTDTGVLLDLSKMNDVDLDLDKQIVTVEGGALWGHVYKSLINGRHNGWAVNGGRCPTVGVSGYILGGGFGPFSRTLGMGCDTVTQFTVVTADGELVTVGEHDKPSSKKGMLFWGLRGGGGGNFGIVVEMKLRVLELSGGDGLVTAGRYTWYPDPRDDNRALITSMNRFYTTNWSDQMTIDSSWLCDTQENNGQIGVRFLAYFDGNAHDFGKQIQNASLDRDLEKQLKRRVLQEKSTRFYHETLVAQWDEETVRAFPSNGTFRLFHSFCFLNDPQQIEAISRIVLEELTSFKELFKGETNCLCQVSFIHSGGQASRKLRGETAFRWRESVFNTYIMCQFRDKFLERDLRTFLGRFRDRLKPLSMTKQAASLNFPDASLADDAYEKAYYGENRLKLQQVKKIWDKDNFFDWAQAVKLPPKSQTRKIALEAVENHESEFSDGEDVSYEGLTDSMASLRWETMFDPAPCEWLATGGPEGGGSFYGTNGAGARTF